MRPLPFPSRISRRGARGLSLHPGMSGLPKGRASASGRALRAIREGRPLWPKPPIRFG